MDIRKVDNKGRIAAGEKGKHYYVEPVSNGTITLVPVPEPQIKVAAFGKAAAQQLLDTVRRNIPPEGGW